MIALLAALACSCAQPKIANVAKALETATWAFTGQVVSIGLLNQRKNDHVFEGEVEVLLETERIWKGPAQRQLMVSTWSLGAGDCGYPFRLGGSYLVLASSEKGGTPSTGMCGFTMELEDPLTQKVIAALPPKPVPPGRALPAKAKKAPAKAEAMPAAELRAILEAALSDDLVKHAVFGWGDEKGVVVIADGPLAKRAGPLTLKHKLVYEPLAKRGSRGAVTFDAVRREGGRAVVQLSFFEDEGPIHARVVVTLDPKAKLWWAQDVRLSH